jgi:hypothetical protein
MTLPSRRFALTGAAAALVAGRAQAADQPYAPPDPAAAYVKMMASVDAVDVPWTYFGIVYAMQPNSHPVPLCRMLGCESYWTTRQADGSYVLNSKTVSTFTDLATDSLFEEFKNPITGKTNKVGLNVFEGGALVVPPDGRPRGQMREGKASPEVAFGDMVWKEFGGDIVVSGWRGLPSGPPPWRETFSMWAPAKQVREDKVDSYDVTGSSNFMLPWFGWMEMKGVPGYVLGNAWTRKLRSFDELTPAFRDRVAKLYGKSLSARPA